jgi:hypothetical protein
MSRDGVCRQRGCILEDMLLPETRNLHQREKNLVRIHSDRARSKGFSRTKNHAQGHEKCEYFSV